ncbi:class I tRNA ligase family protein [Oerskovia sp. M15]
MGRADQLRHGAGLRLGSHRSGAAEDYRTWWTQGDERVHVIGKGITRFHAVYWLALLLSAGEPLPTTIHVHDYVTAGGAKLAKSAGTAVHPVGLVDAYGTDALRWWFAREVPCSATPSSRRTAWSPGTTTSSRTVSATWSTAPSHSCTGSGTASCPRSPRRGDETRRAGLRRRAGRACRGCGPGRRRPAGRDRGRVAHRRRGQPVRQCREAVGARGPGEAGEHGPVARPHSSTRCSRDSSRRAGSWRSSSRRSCPTAPRASASSSAGGGGGGQEAAPTGSAPRPGLPRLG